MFNKAIILSAVAAIIVCGCAGSRATKASAAPYEEADPIAKSFMPSAQSSEILKQLQTGDVYEGRALNKDQLLNNARTATKASDTCKGAQIRLNVSNAAIYIAEADNISTRSAKSIEDYTSKKFTRDVAIKNFNQIVERANDLKLWGDANAVLGACGSMKIIERISKANATKNQLITTYRGLLDR